MKKRVKWITALILTFVMSAGYITTAFAEGTISNEDGSAPEGIIAEQEEVSVQSEEAEDIVEIEADTIVANNYEWEVLRLLNEERYKVGLQPLSMTSAAQTVAYVRKNELPTLFSHTRPDGSSCFTAFVGMDPIGPMAENVARGYTSPAWVMDGWMDSEGHRNNILSGLYEHVGVGFEPSTISWVQVFAGSNPASDITAISLHGYDASMVIKVPRGSSIDEWGLGLTEDCSHGGAVLPLSANFCSGYNPNAMGVQTVTVSIYGKTTSFKVIVANEVVYRLYHPGNGEHLYTTDRNEVRVLFGRGWNYEGSSWFAPLTGTPVYRLYNAGLQNHLYTTDMNEIKVLTTQHGWTMDNGGNPLFYSGGSVSIYRLYNRELRGLHLWTNDSNEYNVLPGHGWKQEGTVMFGQSIGNSHYPLP